MTALVTGGTGFIGAHTVKAIAAAGHDVRLLVRNPKRIEESIKQLRARTAAKPDETRKPAASA